MPAVQAAVGRADRQDMLMDAAMGIELDTLNRQAAMLIVHHGLRVLRNDQVGGYVQTSSLIRAGDLVMLLPPNLLLWEDQVMERVG